MKANCMWHMYDDTCAYVYVQFVIQYLFVCAYIYNTWLFASTQHVCVCACVCVVARPVCTSMI